MNNASIRIDRAPDHCDDTRHLRLLGLCVVGGCHAKTSDRKPYCLGHLLTHDPRVLRILAHQRTESAWLEGVA